MLRDYSRDSLDNEPRPIIPSRTELKILLFCVRGMKDEKGRAVQVCAGCKSCDASMEYKASSTTWGSRTDGSSSCCSSSDEEDEHRSENSESEECSYGDLAVCDGSERGRMSIECSLDTEGREELLQTVGVAWVASLAADINRSIQLLIDEKARVAHQMREKLGVLFQAFGMKEQMLFIDRQLEKYNPENDTMVRQFKTTYGFVNEYCAAVDRISEAAAPLRPSHGHELAVFYVSKSYE